MLLSDKAICALQGLEVKEEYPPILADHREVAKEQLKVMVEYLKTCKGELVSKDGGPFVATFGMPVEDWLAICKEVE